MCGAVVIVLFLRSRYRCFFKESLKSGSFRKAIGTSSRQFSSIVRKLVMNEKQGRRSFYELAFAAGYIDELHFNKGFKRLSGCHPLISLSPLRFGRLIDFIS